MMDLKELRCIFLTFVFLCFPQVNGLVSDHIQCIIILLLQPAVLPEGEQPYHCI